MPAYTITPTPPFRFQAEAVFAPQDVEAGNSLER
jgi:hypothetical protein